MTPDDVDDAMRVIGAAWPGQRFTREQLDLWRTTLQPLDLERVSEAVQRCVTGSDGRWRPDPGAFVEAYRGVGRSSRVAETRAVAAEYALTDEEFERGRRAMRGVLTQCRRELSERTKREERF